ncbi:Chromatin-associated protein swi6 [Zancudomyces culisetae]|uniref:Chromatin-associated protein swi6 n=1 Tax=Zancudomyces culisetae TaxID=1213189 RepID=A0A1R1PN74_ZANCU|nr:Chromatin-associated protein swi6 [Zancudomyces culisetae]|eukprot:OMH82416.1 Chromatin-associated protein swi6 [Zancudomyces culisetae]
MNPEEKVGSESVSENEEGVYNVEALRDHAYNPSKKRKSTKTPIRKRGHNGTSAGYSGKRFREDDEVDMGNDGFIPPPEESWEDLIESVDTVERNSDNKLIIYVRWKNGALTNHLSTLINKKCPQKVSTLSITNYSFAIIVSLSFLYVLLSSFTRIVCDSRVSKNNFALTLGYINVMLPVI